MKTNIDKDAPRVITDTAQAAHRVNVANGWWGDRNDIATQSREAEAIVILSALGLVTSEVAEAMEAVRKHDPSMWSDTKTKDTLARELGGAVVRIMDLAAWLGIDLGAAVVEEIEANATRGYKHGGKAA